MNLKQKHFDSKLRTNGCRSALQLLLKRKKLSTSNLNHVNSNDQAGNMG